VGTWLLFAFRREAVRGRVLQCLIREFPAEVEAWGGLSELSSPAVVGAIVEQVTRPTFHVSESPPPAARSNRGPKAEVVSGPIPVADVRKEALLSRLRDLRADLHRPPKGNTWAHFPVMLLAALVTLFTTLVVVGSFTGEMSGVVALPALVIPTVTFTVLVPWALSHLLAGNARRRYDARMQRHIARIRAAFPGDYASWGEAAQLTDRAFMDAVLKRVQSPDYEVQPPAAPVNPLPEPPADPR
jgi:hypothetical protein